MSGKVKLKEADKPALSRFFSKPLESRQMIAEIQDMVGAGALKIVPSTEQDILTAENDSLRLLLEQAGIDAKALLAQSGIEAEQREAADRLQKLILEEMHHRIKNTLAMVGAIASQSLRNAINPAHARQAIEGRLAALGRAHDLLMQANWGSASLRQSVLSATEAYDHDGAGQIAVSGPDVKISSGAVIALAMTFNELCTNTTKFGALSVPTGRVTVAWAIDDKNQRLRLEWNETGGPAVKEPGRRSFGTRMMMSLGQQLKGRVELAYHPAGLVYVLDVPLESLTADAASGR